MCYQKSLGLLVALLFSGQFWGKSRISKANEGAMPEKVNQVFLSLESLPAGSLQKLTPSSKIYPNTAGTLWGISAEYRRLTRRNLFRQNLNIFGRFQYAGGAGTFSAEQETAKADLKISLIFLVAGAGITFPFKTRYYIMPQAGVGFHYAPMSMSHPTQSLYEQTLNRYGPVILLGGNLGMTLPNNLLGELRLSLINLLYSGNISSIINLALSLGYKF